MGESAQVAFIAGVMALGCVAAVGALGFYVVKRYPERNDPDRDRLRYVVPAAALTFSAFGLLLVTLGAAVVWIVQAFTS